MLEEALNCNTPSIQMLDLSETALMELPDINLLLSEVFGSMVND